NAVQLRATATASEVSSMLHLILRQIRRITLAFDAVDECADQQVFFRDMHYIAEGAPSCFILLSGRPTVMLPRLFPDDYVPIDLNRSQNLLDIECYLRPKIRELLDSGALTATHADNKRDLEGIVRRISSRA